MSGSPHRAQTLEILRDFGYERRDTPFRLSSGEVSHDYIDGKKALASGSHLRSVAHAVIEVARERSVEFDAVGGLTMGADALAHAVSVITGCRWFSVRKEAKAHGTQSLVEGAPLEGVEVLLVDDVVTTGGSILKALEAVEESGGVAVLAVALCDRGDRASELLAGRGVPYEPLVTYGDLGIPPVG